MAAGPGIDEQLLVLKYRRYERGANRFKHIGSNSFPEILLTGNEVVGKCPTGRSQTWRESLLKGAVGYITGEPYSTEFPKRLFTVDTDGTVYAAQTSNPGDSYHGYPYSGEMGKRLQAALAAKADAMGCRPSFDAWIKKHVTRAGKPDI